MILEGLKEFNETLSRIKGGMRKSSEVRAKSFKDFTTSEARKGALGLSANRRTTQMIQGTSHAPEYWSGELVGNIKTKQVGDAVEAGYFGDGEKPGPKALSDGYVSQSGLTFTQIATLQHTGYRIPLTDKVRGFLSRYGVRPSRTRQFLIVKPRPFLQNSAVRFDDLDVTEDFWSQVWGAL